METVSAGLNRVVCLDYIDDILVVGATFMEHLNVYKNGTCIKFNKRHFSVHAVTVLVAFGSSVP